ncbi:MAG: ribulose-bisphosphate carboxylase large subunit, partial [Candidatus Aenigmarchaeota archaeon]|nr:ribulose-bisphosphate carboxylase large subunit [Candidatus Aenigmarchaeota archaeon]
MKYEDYVDLGYKPGKNDLICLFRVEPARGFTIKEVSGRVASESSTGTWTESLVTETKEVEKRLKGLSAKVFEIKGNYIKVAYPIELFEPGNMPQILSSIAGNVFGMKAVKNL